MPESTGDDALAVQGHFFQDKTALPAEKVSSLDVHEAAKAVATNETTTSNDSKINAHRIMTSNATCKHLVSSLATLGVCRFHCDTSVRFVSYYLAFTVEFWRA